jgi:hypothetical protein
MPAISVLVNRGWPSAASGFVVAVGGSVDVAILRTVVERVELDLSPVGRLTVDVGVVAVVSDVDSARVVVRIAVGTRRGPVPVAGRTRVTTRFV